MASDFTPLEKSNLSDNLVEHLVKTIRSGVYKPGDRLPAIMDMARSFGVGHPTLREALKKLEVIGIVEIRHGSGVYVGKGQDVLLFSNPIFYGEISKKLLLDLIEARLPVEIKAVGLAAVEAEPAHLALMAELLDEAEANLDDPDVLTTTNMAFHREIAVSSGNSVLAQILDVLTSLFHREQRMILDIYGSREKDHQEHVGILNALRQRNPLLAQAHMETHLNGVRKVLLQWDPKKTPIS